MYNRIPKSCDSIYILGKVKSFFFLNLNYKNLTNHSIKKKNNEEIHKTKFKGKHNTYSC